jgi:hypothetical protein
VFIEWNTDMQEVEDLSILTKVNNETNIVPIEIYLSPGSDFSHKDKLNITNYNVTEWKNR